MHDTLQMVKRTPWIALGALPSSALATQADIANAASALDAQMRNTPDQQISLTDPDARSMATSGRVSSATMSRSRWTPNTI